ncbi:MAG: hypothetical protein JXR96_02710 [Deltaproteobacteria bacterium]|nr:hypothetical protein [Deltaproteobacteria bacterium]
MGTRRLSQALACFGLCVLAGCGAFADAAGGDDGDGGAACALSIEPDIVLRQGQTAIFSISFDTPPPWADEPKATGYLTHFDFDAKDIEYITNYDGKSSIEATLKASRQARTGERSLFVEVRYAPPGQKQQSHSCEGSLFVVPPRSLDGGTDGGGS